MRARAVPTIALPSSTGKSCVTVCEPCPWRSARRVEHRVPEFEVGVSGWMVLCTGKARAPIRNMARAPKYSGFQDHCTFDPSAIPPIEIWPEFAGLLERLRPADHVSLEVSPSPAEQEELDP